MLVWKAASMYCEREYFRRERINGFEVCLFTELHSWDLMRFSSSRALLMSVLSTQTNAYLEQHGCGPGLVWQSGIPEYDTVKKAGALVYFLCR